ncbi:MAG: molybdate ABC transporter substrate-binding protein [Planktomarina sp.]
MWRIVLAVVACCAFTPAVRAEVTVFAAASLKQPLEAISGAQEAPWVMSFAASSTLARQIEFGAPADVILSASPLWIDYLVTRGHGQGQAVDFASNALVLAARPPMDDIPLTVQAIMDAKGAGRIAVPLLDAVPLGQYTKAALIDLNLLSALMPHLAQTDNAASTRTLLTEGAVPLAFLYQSDLHGTDLAAVAHVPPQSHPPIRYVGLALTEKGAQVLNALTSPEGQNILQDHGFTRVD